MISVLNIIKLTQGKTIRLELMADSTEDELPIKAADVPGLTGEELIEKGSTCVTANLDCCMMGNGKWGDWM